MIAPIQSVAGESAEAGRTVGEQPGLWTGSPIDKSGHSGVVLDYHIAVSGVQHSFVIIETIRRDSAPGVAVTSCKANYPLGIEGVEHKAKDVGPGAGKVAVSISYVRCRRPVHIRVEIGYARPLDPPVVSETHIPGGGKVVLDAGVRDEVPVVEVEAVAGLRIILSSPGGD